MKIKYIVLDGFKSYGKKTVLENFDARFNAVTGLNGSGKSNILDSICFVLGLNQFKMARATKMQDLIYQNGQANVKEAVVSICFDNTNKDKSPQGYQQMDTITVTRKIIKKKNSKSFYYINGKSMTNTKVKSMFKSVGLNIDNPETFYVKQGRITKIVNFKPVELKEMLEEAAGVAFYHDISRKCLKTIKTKGEKQKTEEERMRRNLGPRLKQLEMEKRNNQEFEALQKEQKLMTEEVNKLSYYLSYHSREQAKKDIDTYQERLDEINQQTQKLKDEKEALNQQSRQNKDDNTDSFEQIKTMREKLRESNLELNKLSEKHKRTKASLEDKKRQITAKEQKVMKVTTKNNLRSIEIDKHRSKLQELKQTQSELEVQLDNKIRNKEDLATNLGNDNYNITELYKQRLHDVVEKIQNQESEVENFSNKITECEGKLKKLGENKASGSKLQEVLREKLRTLNSQLIEKGNLQEDYHQKKETFRDWNNRESAKIKSKENEINNKLLSLNIKDDKFNPKYRDPDPNFDRKKVKGYVFTNFEFNPEYKVALEVAVGGALSNIIVDEFKTSRRLLQAKSFRGYVNFLPLDNLKPSPLSKEKIMKAAAIAESYGQKVIPASSQEVLKPLSLGLGKVVESIFGNLLIAQSLEVAREIAYHKDIRTNVVTIGGDLVQSNGMMNGGFYKDDPQTSFAQWIRYKEVKDLKNKLAREKDRYNREKAKTEQSLDEMTKDLDIIRKVKKEIEQTNREMMENNEEEIKLRISNLKAEVKETVKKKKNYTKQIKEDLKQKEDILKQLKAARNSRSRTSGNSLKEMEVQIENYNKEIKQIEDKMNSIKQELILIEGKITSTKAEISEKNEEVEVIRKKIEDEKRKLEQIQQESLGQMKEVKQKELDIQQLSTEIEETQAQAERLISKFVVINKSLTNLKQENKQMNELLNEASEKYNLNIKALSEVDQEIPRDVKEELKDIGFFASMKNAEDQISGARVELVKINDKIQILRPKLNTNADNMGEDLKEKMIKLKHKKDILNKNKEELTTDIDYMDDLSVRAYEKCYKMVNENLGKMFSQLLPGAKARMQKVDAKGKEPGGIRIRVCFSGQWKESLSELSGGQKSLLALSFMLSMLKYKSAPFYILDEIDAAMDLSHTENIGLIISKYFPESQFMVISLKKGMYRSANVLFKTKLVDGKSVVQRIEKKKSEQPSEEMQEI